MAFKCWLSVLEPKDIGDHKSQSYDAPVYGVNGPNLAARSAKRVIELCYDGDGSFRPLPFVP